jgi:hypothetical protein
MEQRIIGTVVGVEPQDANTFFVEVECEALEDATAFQIVSTDLPFKHVALNRAAGSRLKLICAQGAEISVGRKVRFVVRPSESSDLRRRQSENALACGEHEEDQTSKPVGTFAGPIDMEIRTRKGHAIPQDTGDQGGGQN